MADAQIATVLIPCLVVQYNNQEFVENGTIIGQTLDVPCRNVDIGEVGYWCIPTKSSGIFVRFTYQLQVEKGQNGRFNVPQPTFDSFSVFRVTDKETRKTWWIYGTKEQFINSCSTCCGSATSPMPGIDGQFAPLIAPCQIFCDIFKPGSTSIYRTIWGIPNVYGPDAFFPVGSYNNVPFAVAPSGSGYATPTLLLAFLNANWTQGGILTWSTSADGLTLFADGGLLSDSLCIGIFRIGPSS
jgi:hypothetical protein